MSSTQTSTEKSFCYWDGEDLVLNVLGTPSAKKDAIGKPKGAQLKISVTATPADGRATDHMVKFLAKVFGVPAKSIKVVFGQYQVNKQLRIHAPKKWPPVIQQALMGVGEQMDEGVRAGKRSLF